MKKILAFGASISSTSINKKLANYVARQLSDVEVKSIDLKDYTLPFYSPDLETSEGIPEKANQFNDLLGSVDGIVMSMAEYNGNFTGAFKNLLDWLSRIDREVWKNKPLFLLSTSPGKKGGQNVMKITKEMLPFFGGNLITDFSLPGFHDNYSDSGIKDQALSNELLEKIDLYQKAIDKV